MLSISIVAEEVWNIGGWPITNSLFTTWIGMAVLVIVVFIGLGRRALVPAGLQMIFEAVYGFFLNLCETVLDQKRWAEKAAPFITTIFLFVFVGNVIGLLPGVGSIGFFEKETVKAEEVADGETVETPPSRGGQAGIVSTETDTHEVFIPLFRAPTSDLNTTVALALISVAITQIVGFRMLGWGYLKKFFNFSNPINFFVGILETISEFAKIISFSFRLFGNIFAGEVLLDVIGMLVPYFLPIPFYGLELFVALIQAFVFAMLTLVFIKLAMTSHAEEHH